MNIKKAHVVGIGGVSMSAIAEYLLDNNIIVTGSDRQKSDITTKLEGMGVTVFYSHNKSNITDQDIVIKTAAVKDDSPEIVASKELGIKVLERAEFLGEVQKQYNNVICVAGTHGKTSTTSMISSILLGNDADPTIMVGSYLDLIDGTYKNGTNEYFLIESCEYCNSFLSFKPTIAVINNIEADHLDFFKDLDDVITSFSKFANLVPDCGVIVYNSDDKNVCKSLIGLEKNKISFGLENADIHPRNIQNKNEYYTFDAYYKDFCLGEFTLSIPGEHNLYNALASIAVAYFINMDMNISSNYLSKFTGPQRRFQRIGEFNGALVVDDYAHHPTEVKTTLETASKMGFNRVICVFQSHTYTRTIALYDEFIEALKLCDYLIMAEIYSAREINETGITAKSMVEKIENATFIEDFNEIELHLKQIAEPGDLIITMGAGELNKIAYNLVKW